LAGNGAAKPVLTIIVLVDLSIEVILPIVIILLCEEVSKPPLEVVGV